MDDHELESDEKTEEEVKKKRKSDLRNDAAENGMLAEPADG